LGVASDEPRWTIEEGYLKMTAGVYSFKLLLFAFAISMLENGTSDIYETIEL